MARRFLDPTSLDFGLGDLLSIVVVLRAQAARPPAIIAWFSEIVLVDWNLPTHYVGACRFSLFLACVNVISHLLVAQESPLLAQR